MFSVFMFLMVLVSIAFYLNERMDKMSIVENIGEYDVTVATGWSMLEVFWPVFILSATLGFAGNMLFRLICGYMNKNNGISMS